MFQGEVLTSTGWREPRPGDSVACMGENNGIVWRNIGRAEQKPGDFLHVETRLMHYAVSLSHELLVLSHRGFASKPADAIYKLWEKSPSRQVKVRHITRRWPESKDCSRAVVDTFAVEHAQGNMLTEKELLIFRDKLEYRLMYPHAYINGQSIPEPYRMCEYDAIELLTVIWSHMRNHDYTRKAEPLAPVRTFKTAGTDFLQAACFLASITSVVTGDIIKIHCHGKKGKYAVWPTITPSAKVEIKQGSGWDIDVEHPVVRLGGKVLVL